MRATLQGCVERVGRRAEWWIKDSVHCGRHLQFTLRVGQASMAWLDNVTKLRVALGGLTVSHYSLNDSSQQVVEDLVLPSHAGSCLEEPRPHVR